MSEHYPFPVSSFVTYPTDNTRIFTDDKVSGINLDTLLNELFAYRKYYDHAELKTEWARFRLTVSVMATSIREAKERGDIPSSDTPRS